MEGVALDKYWKGGLKTCTGECLHLKLFKFHKIGPWISHSGKLLSLYAVALTIAQGCTGGSLEKKHCSVLKGNLWMSGGGYLPDFSQAEIVIPVLQPFKYVV